MSTVLMPKATAVWLIENTSLSFEQISAFCGLHILEIQALADSEISITGLDPIATGQLSPEEIKRAEADPKVHLVLNPPKTPASILGKTKGKYVPVSKRQDKPNGIAWLIKYHPELSDADIIKLLGTTKNMISSIRNKSHWNSANLQPSNPVSLGLCSQKELDRFVKA